MGYIRCPKHPSNGIFRSFLTVKTSSISKVGEGVKEQNCCGHVRKTYPPSPIFLRTLDDKLGVFGELLDRGSNPPPPLPLRKSFLKSRCCFTPAFLQLIINLMIRFR